MTQVLGKTEGLYPRGERGAVVRELSPETKALLSDGTPYSITVKTDGTCGLLCLDGTSYYLMRRQDLRVGTANHKLVMETGALQTFAGRKCFIAPLLRGKVKTTVYIFNLDADDKPEPEFDHLIGFTPLLHDFGDDKHVLTSINGTNGTPDMKVYSTCPSESLQIPVRIVSCRDLLGGETLRTVEIMGSKVSNKYGFTTDQHFINPHGSIVFPTDQEPPLDDFKRLEEWFANGTNPWSDVEGFVVHFPTVDRRLKFHQGYVGREKIWQSRKTSGMSFIFE
jgi:hypothetical protein